VSEIKRVAHKGMDKEGGREGVRVEERERERMGGKDRVTLRGYNSKIRNSLIFYRIACGC